MEEKYVTKVRTSLGDVPIDYNALVNKPDVDGKAPKMHRSQEEIYGTADWDYYGHVKLSKASSGVNPGIAASLDSLIEVSDKVDEHSDEFNSINIKITQTENKINDVQNAVSEKAIINHATSATTFGIATDSNYGHVKLSDAYMDNNGTPGVAATPAAVAYAYSLAMSAYDGVLNIKDFITEQGTSVIGTCTWIYRKWNSGFKECWGKYSREIDVNSGGTNGLYYSSKSLRATFPFQFSNTPVCTATLNGVVTGSGTAEGEAGATCYAAWDYTKDPATTTQTQELAVYASRSSGLTGVVANIDFYAFGK